MAIDLNKYGNCTTDFTGSGQTTCDLVQFGDLNGKVLFKKGYSKTIASDDFNLASWKLDVKGFNALPYLGIRDFTQDTPENEKSSSSTGVQSVIRDGKPQFSFMYEKGGCLQKSLANKARGSWDFGLVFEKGILMAQSADGTKIKGFNGGMLSVETMKLQQGTDPQMTTSVIQLLDAEEFNTRFIFFPFTEIGDLKEVSGVVETVITVDPIAAGGDITFSVVTSCNADNNILDLDAASKFVLLGTQASATTLGVPTYNATTNKYTITPSPALVENDTVQIKLGDGTYDAVEDSLGTIFKGTSNSVTVSA
jgi:hypothetical protein